MRFLFKVVSLILVMIISMVFLVLTSQKFAYFSPNTNEIEGLAWIALIFSFIVFLCIEARPSGTRSLGEDRNMY